ncbi:MAG: FHA domain-containing protein [Chloroflexota bacterium]
MHTINFRIFLRLLIVLFLLLPQAAQAQDIPHGNLYNLKTVSFPVFKVSVDVFDASGNLISGLTQSDFTILEDGLERAPDSVERIDPGLEFVAAINPGFSFSILDDQARSRYEKVAAELKTWVGKLPGTGNNAYSLVTSGGSSAFHVSDPKSWLISLEAYQLDSKNLVPSFDILSKAIDLASTSLLQPGARRAILFITQMAGMDDLSTLQSMALRAIQLDVHVFVWVVAPADSPLTPGYQALIDLAKQTGGELFLYSGSEALPNLADYLAPLRTSYQLTYTTGLTSSGSHSLAVQVTTPDGQIDLTPIEFEMDIQPPNPILVSPPSQILRQYPAGGNYAIKNLTPVVQNLEIIIEFPDGKPRPLVSSSLVVDDQTVVKNISEPFDEFTWDLRGYTSSGRHEIQVMVVDMLGLQKTSISIPITVEIAEIPGNWSIFLERYWQWLVLVAILLASLGLVVLLINIKRKLQAGRKAGRIKLKSPSIRTDEKPTNLKKWSRQSSAFLEPIPPFSQVPSGGILQLPATEIRFGSDATISAYVLEDASVEPLHAIIRKSEEAFTIQDQGSIAGTWVNYEMLGEEQSRLKHGDIIHIGQLAFRFLLRTPPDCPGPHITPD